MLEWTKTDTTQSDYRIDIDVLCVCVCMYVCVCMCVCVCVSNITTADLFALISISDYALHVFFLFTAY
jgi:hypothetical protein